MEITPSSFRPTWTEINLNAIENNLSEFRRILPRDVQIMAVVKADAYGHGAVEVAETIARGGAACFAVAFLEEAIELRMAGIKKPILLIGPTPPEQASEIISYGFTQTVFSLENAEIISREALKAGKKVKVHVKVDTGMGRVGIKPEETVNFMKELSKLPGISLEGIFTHFASADSEDISYTEQQMKIFAEILADCRGAGINIPIVHAANSAGAIGVPDAHYNLIRLGISLYGYFPSEAMKTDRINLKPALSFKTRIVFLKKVPPGTYLSYGNTYVTKSEAIIATIPVGYADGYNRFLSNRGQVLVRSKRAPIVGRVCMDYSLIDVTHIENASVGDEVVLYGTQGDAEISVDEVAASLGTISYELLCSVDKRVSRFYLRDGKVVNYRNLLNRNKDINNNVIIQD